MAKAVFLTVLSAITGVPLSSSMFKGLLGGNLNNLTGGALGSVSSMNVNVNGIIRGKDIYLSNQRYQSELGYGT